MQNNNKVLIAGLSFVISIIVVISIIFMLGSNIKNNALNTNNLKIYYVDKLFNVLNYEETSLGEVSEIIETTFLKMKEIPKTSGLSPAIPQDIDLINYNLYDNILTLNITENYYSLSNIEKIFLKSSLVLTYTNNSIFNLNILNIKEVNILVNDYEILSSFGEVTGTMSTENVLINPVISAEKLAIIQAILYFSDDSLNYLIPENKLLQIKQSQTLEYQIVEKIISGPTASKYVRTVPANTKIKNIKTEDGICYVDLSSEFLAKNTISVSEEIAIYSIVNSLTELEEINRVQFLIDGKKVDIYGSSIDTGIDISSPLAKNEAIIFKE